MKKNVKKKIVLFPILLIFLINLMPFNANLSNNKNQTLAGDLEHIKNQDLSFDNSLTGIGAPWNVTHWANASLENFELSFENNSYDLVDIPVGNGWEGHKINATISDLSDTRNWINGTFNAGPDDNNDTCPENDSDFLSNWTYGFTDASGNVNVMSGNYFDDSYINSSGHDCLELRINGSGSSNYGYDGADECWWNTTVEIPRGEVIDSTFKIEFNPIHMLAFSIDDFGLVVYLNNERIYKIENTEMSPGWTTKTLPQIVWTNTSNIFDNPVNNSKIDIRIVLEVVSLSSVILSSAITNSNYQQLLIDNVQLNVKTAVKPSQINLTLNGTGISDIDWGEGYIGLEGSWKGDILSYNFSNIEKWDLGSYQIELVADINISIIKNDHETLYETNIFSYGTNFVVRNDTEVFWDCWAYTFVPTGFKESEIRISFPTDLNITRVSEPLSPLENKLDQCINSTQGLLIIPVPDVSLASYGFWKFEGISPNYCDSIMIFKNTTIIPSANDWISENTFISGDYINITAKITNSPLLSGYINQTKANLKIRFPNGTIWNAQSLFVSPNSSGYVHFNYFQIPIAPPNYEAGVYQAIISWNNSYSTYALNESGIIVKEFYVVHNSNLIPDVDNFGEVLYGSNINIRVSFNDVIDNTPIQNALVYTEDFNGMKVYFSEISPGYYFLEFETINATAGSNVLTIYANSTFYDNKTVNISMYFIFEGLITSGGIRDYIIKPGEFFTLQIKLIGLETGAPVKGALVKLYWEFGQETLHEVVDGDYQIILEAIPIGTFELRITASATGYTFESIILSLTVRLSGDQVSLIFIILITIIIIIALLGLILFLRSKRTIHQRDKELAKLQEQRELLSDEDVVFSKEKHTCLVHKGPIKGYAYICPNCDAYYCPKCTDAVIEIENICWSCGKPLEPSKPSKSIEAKTLPKKIEETRTELTPKKGFKQIEPEKGLKK